MRNFCYLDSEIYKYKFTDSSIVKILKFINLKLKVKRIGEYRSSILILAIPMLLSSFTHLWNVTGFPAIYMDEDIYMRKALHALQGIQLETDRSNPVYGWLFLSVALGGIGYPNSLHPSTDVHSIEMLYLVPRLLIGIAGVLDTFLLYKICERHFNRNTALIASILFAVMPMGWLTRYILLESIQLPLLLSSILFAIYAKDSKSSAIQKNIDRRISIILISGIFLGLAIFAKIHVIPMIPAVGFLIYRNNKSLKILGLWFIPVVLIPLISPAYASSFGMFNVWWDSILYNIHRGNHPLIDLTGSLPNNAIAVLLRIDPVLLALGTIGLVFAAIKRDLLLLLLTVPYIIFFHFLGYVAFYHFIPLIPAFCIAGAKVILFLADKIKGRNKKVQHILPFAIFSVIGIFGFISTIMLITTNINSTHFEAAAIIAQHLPDTDSYNTQDKKVTVIIGQTRFFWILKDVFHKHHYYISYWKHDSPLNQTRMVVTVAEGTFNYWKRTDVDKKHVSQLLKIYNDSQKVVVLNKDTDSYDLSKYPYTGMNIPNPGIGRVEIRTNTEGAILFHDLLKRLR